MSKPTPSPRKTTARRPLSTLPAATNVKKSGGGGGVWLIVLLLLAAVGGGWYYYDQQEKEKARLEAQAQARAKEEAARKRAAEEEARRKAAAEEARRKAEEEEARRRAEEEEAARRRAEEEARRKAQEVEKTDTPEEPEPTPVEPQPEEPTETPTQVGPYEADLPLIGGATTTRENKELYNSMIERVLTEGDFQDFERAFAEKIKAAIPEIVNNDKLNFNSYKRSKQLMQAVALCHLIRLTGVDNMKELVKPSPGTMIGENELGTEGGKLFMQWMLKDKSDPLHHFMHSYTANSGHPRNMNYHLQTLYKLWLITPERDRTKYLNLAIACALIEPGRAAANSQVKTKEPTLNIEQVYNYFREMDAKNKLLTDVKKMDVSDLLFVVDVRLPKSEFDWVQKNMKYTQAQWGDAYSSIRYRMEIAAGSLSEAKLYQKYNFAEIREDGGVCRHQAYFAANTAKCKGIPAVYIVGDGDRGPHAWIASMTDNVTWKQTGSYGYNTGRFANPCSGRSMHESVLLNQTKKTSDDKLSAAYEGMLLAEYLVSIGSSAEARGTARYVTGAFPQLTTAWSSRIRVLTADKENMPNADYWRKMSNELKRHGKKNAELLDLAGEIDSNYALEGKNYNAKRTAMKRNLDKLVRTIGDERSDLLLEAVNSQAELLAEEKDIRGLTQLYNKMLKETTKRGDIFGSLLRQYIKHMQEAEASKRDWSAMARATEKLYEKGVQSNTSDHFKLSKEVEVQKIIGDIYEKAGNTKKAEKLRESAEERLRLSKERNG